jgi:hypothetical protein
MCVYWNWQWHKFGAHTKAKEYGELRKGGNDQIEWPFLHIFLPFLELHRLETFLRNFRVIYLALLYETIMAIGEWAKNG